MGIILTSQPTAVPMGTNSQCGLLELPGMTTWVMTQGHLWAPPWESYWGEAGGRFLLTLPLLTVGQPGDRSQSFRICLPWRHAFDCRALKETRAGRPRLRWWVGSWGALAQGFATQGSPIPLVFLHVAEGRPSDLHSLSRLLFYHFISP